jgi:hypothetical protein
MAEFYLYTLLSLQYSLYGLYLHSLLHPMAIYQPINGREYAISRRI